MFSSETTIITSARQRISGGADSHGKLLCKLSQLSCKLSYKLSYRLSILEEEDHGDPEAGGRDAEAEVRPTHYEAFILNEKTCIRSGIIVGRRDFEKL